MIFYLKNNRITHPPPLNRGGNQSNLNTPPMLITCEFNHDQYGPLTLTGQLHEAEADVNLDSHAVLESAIDEYGDDLHLYRDGSPVFFLREDIKKMESALLYRGEAVASRAKPTPETIAFVRAATVK